MLVRFTETFTPLSTGKIKTYSTETFREAYMQPGEKLDDMLKSGFGKFFITPVQDLIRLIRLPVPPMRSTTHTFIYLTAGEAIMSVGSETHTIYANECLFVPAGQVFSFTNVDINEGYLCNFHNDFILERSGHTALLNTFEFLTVWGNPRIVLPEESSAFVAQNLRRIHLDYTSNGLQHAALLHHYFMAVLSEIQLAYVPLTGKNQTATAVVSNRFRELLFQHIRTQHRVADYAGMLHITPNHLNRVVKQVTGKSPTKWIDEALIMEARILLHQTTFPINRVAEEIGIQDASYFSRLFKKYEGITPQEFRHRFEKS